MAPRDGENYVVNGGKMWITNCIEGHVLALLVKTDINAQPRHHGMTMLIMPKINVDTRACPGVR